MITPAGVVTTLAGSPFSSGSADGNGSAAQFSIPMAVAFGLDGALYVADSDNNTIRRVTLAGDVTTVAGTAGVVGSADGVGSAASFHSPEVLTTSASGTIYIADADAAHNNLVRAFVPSTGMVTTLVGAKATPAGFAAGPLPGNIVWPRGLAVSGSDLYIGSEQGVAVANNVIQ
jgi:sugar lactone lactonase YvrE